MEEEQHAALMAVAHTLTEPERQQFLANCSHWSRLAGAEVADVLDLTTDYDMFLEKTEPFFEQYNDQLPRTPGNIYALHLLILLNREPSLGGVLAVLQKAGVIEAPLYPDARASLRLEDGCTANAILVASRAEQAMRADGVPEEVITQFRASVRKTGQPGMAYALADVARYVTLVDAYELPAHAPYNPAHDLAVVVMWAASLGELNGAVGHAMANLKAHIGTSEVAEAEAHLSAMLRVTGRF